MVIPRDDNGADGRGRPGTHAIRNDMPPPAPGGTSPAGHSPDGGGAALDRVLGKLEGVTEHAGYWMARCPAHEDTQPSLSVARGDKHPVLLTCHAGCQPADILTALGLTWPDLSAPRDRADGDDWTPAGPAVATYAYTDQHGKVLFGVCRTAGKQFRQWRPDPDKPHGRAWSVKGVRLVLYRLPKVLAAVDAGEVIYVAEGEKDVHALEAAGVTATCNPGGAGKWQAAYAATLAGAEVVIVADNDHKGHEHARKVAASLDGKAASVQVVTARAGKDAADHLAAGVRPGRLHPPGPGRPGDPAPAARRAEPVAGGRDPGARRLAGPSNPMAVARELIADHTDDAGLLTLRRWRGGWMTWRRTRWAEAEETEIRAWLYEQLEDAEYLDTGGNVPEVRPWEPTRHKVSDVIDALTAITHLPETTDPPAWLDGPGEVPAGEVVACENALLHVGTRKQIGHTPAYFGTVAVPFAYDPGAPAPARWLRFLAELWPEDGAAVAALQEWFGYVLSGRTDLHKILLLIGPARSGKGTIARVLGALIGAGNVAGPTLASLGTNFGLSPLLGKPLAVISDARLGRRDTEVVVERLLSVSGEDTLTVDRKYREPWTGKLPSRFVVLSNELPRFGDASGAISSRFVVLTTEKSWLGHENTRLTAELLTELPGILSWALDGLDRLTRAGALTEPPSSADAIIALQDLVSPVSAFVRDRCQRRGEVPVDDLFDAWKAWCENNGHRPGSVQTFGRDLRAAVPVLRVRQSRDGDARERRYAGVSLQRAQQPSASPAHNGPDRVPPRATCDARGCDDPARHCGSGTYCRRHAAMLGAAWPEDAR